MDISKETNIEKLQSMAYIQYRALNVAQQNLQILENRIKDLEEAKFADETKEDEKSI